MKISELIELLGAFQGAYGDINVYLYNDGGIPDQATQVSPITDPYSPHEQAIEIA